jgi:uncharacterized protein (TIGR00369 family)
VTVAEVRSFTERELPFCSELGISCEALEPDGAVGRWTFSRRWTRPVDFVCGPVMMALADASIYWATFTRAGIVPLALTNELKTTFLRPAASGVDLLCRARLPKVGRKVIYGIADIYEDGAPERLVAQATSTYVLAD